MHVGSLPDLCCASNPAKVSPCGYQSYKLVIDRRLDWHLPLPAAVNAIQYATATYAPPAYVFLRHSPSWVDCFVHLWQPASTIQYLMCIGGYIDLPCCALAGQCELPWTWFSPRSQTSLCQSNTSRAHRARGIQGTRHIYTFGKLGSTMFFVDRKLDFAAIVRRQGVEHCQKRDIAQPLIPISQPDQPSSDAILRTLTLICLSAYQNQPQQSTVDLSEPIACIVNDLDCTYIATYQIHGHDRPVVHERSQYTMAASDHMDWIPYLH